MFPATSAANVEDPRNARHENKRFRKILRLQRGLQLAVCIMVYVKKSDPFENACTWRPSYEINNVEMFFVLQTTTADKSYKRRQLDCVFWQHSRSRRSYSSWLAHGSICFLFAR